MAVELREQRKADREKMAVQLAATLTAAGATVTREESFSDREIRLAVRVTGGAICWPEFDGESWQPNVYVVTWNTEHDHPDARFSLSFGDVNPYHQRKATRVAHGFDALSQILAADVGALLSGQGYAK